MNIKSNVQYLSVVLFCVFLTFGCVSALDKLKTDMSAKGVQPLTKDEIVAVYSDKTKKGSTYKFDYVIFNAADGTQKGKAWGAWGEKQDVGTWRVTDDGLVCSKWSGPWSKYGERCSVVYPGDKAGEYVEAIVTGKKSKGNPSGVYRFAVVDGDQTGI